MDREQLAAAVARCEDCRLTQGYTDHLGAMCPRHYAYWRDAVPTSARGANTSPERLEIIRRTFEHGPQDPGPKSFAPGPVFHAMGDLLAMLDERGTENARLREALEEISAQAPCRCGSGEWEGRHLSSCPGGLGDLAREALEGEGG